MNSVTEMRTDLANSEKRVLPWRTGILLSTALILFGCARAAPPIPPPVPESPAVEIEARIVFVGDGGVPKAGGEPVLVALEEKLRQRPHATVVIFLGDNLYPKGMPDSTAQDRAEMERRLTAQVAVVDSISVRGIFVPGNHDWSKGGKDGWASILRQGDFIQSLTDSRVQLLPSGGCPGPWVVDVGERVRLVALDTQWWIQGDPRPEGKEAGCAHGTEEEFLSAVDGALGGGGEREVFVFGHHPIMTSSKHSGYFPWEDYLFPLREIKSWLWLPVPILGILYPVARQNGISNQDISGSKNKEMMTSLQELFAKHKPLVYAAGHEHILEVLRWSNVRYLLVSGAGYYGHNTPVTSRDQTLYVSRMAGFMQVDVLRDGRIRLGVIAVDESGNGTEVYSQYLTESDPKP